MLKLELLNSEQRMMTAIKYWKNKQKNKVSIGQEKAHFPQLISCPGISVNILATCSFK
jgi:hypothetical protein